MGSGARQVEEYSQSISWKMDRDRRTHVVRGGWESETGRRSKSLRSSADDILSRSSRDILEARTCATVRSGVGLQGEIEINPELPLPATKDATRAMFFIAGSGSSGLIRSNSSYRTPI